MKTLKYSILIVIIFALYSCGKEQSSTTGWNYNDQENGGFQKMPFERLHLLLHPHSYIRGHNFLISLVLERNNDRSLHHKR